MSRTLPLAAALVVAVGTVVLFAQQTTPDQQLVTVKGCVERSPVSRGAGVSPTGTTAAPGRDTTFVLTHVTTEAGPTSSSSTAQRGALADARTYRLDAADEARLADHVGHTVEINGRLESQPEVATGTSGSTDTSSADAIAPKLKVDSLRVMSDTCGK